MTILRYILSFILLSAVGSAAFGQMHTMEMRSSDFHSLNVSGALTVECRNVPDSAGLVVVRATGTGLSMLKAATTGGTLNLSVPHGNVRGQIGVITVYPYRPISSLMVTGRAGVYLSAVGALADDVSVSLTGSGRIGIDLLQARMLNVSLNGSGSIDARSCTCAEIINTSCSGSGSINLDGIASGTVNATVTGSGNITFAGSAARGAFVVNGDGLIDSNALTMPRLKASVYGNGRVAYNPAARAPKFTGNTLNIFSGKPQ